jgi:NAD(P)H-dependent FMN reductase
MRPNLNIVVGSTRPGRLGPTIGKWCHNFAREHDKFEVELVDLREFRLPLLDEGSHPRLQQYEHETTRKWSESVASADAYVFVTPEYDYFPPASLVNAVQVLLREWSYKCAGIVSYGGISGGLRSTQVLRQLLGNVNVHALPQTVPMPNFNQFIDQHGTFQPSQPIQDGMRVMLDELAKWANALKPLR